MELDFIVDKGSISEILNILKVIENGKKNNTKVMIQTVWNPKPISINGIKFDDKTGCFIIY